MRPSFPTHRAFDAFCREIRKYQGKGAFATKRLIPKAPFWRLAREVLGRERPHDNFQCVRCLHLHSGHGRIGVGSPAAVYLSRWVYTQTCVGRASRLLFPMHRREGRGCVVRRWGASTGGWSLPQVSPASGQSSLVEKDVDSPRASFGCAAGAVGRRCVGTACQPPHWRCLQRRALCTCSPSCSFPTSSPCLPSAFPQVERAGRAGAAGGGRGLPGGPL